MLTQLRPLDSTTVTLDQHSNGIDFDVADNLIGNIKVDLVCSLDGSTWDTAQALKLSNSDNAFLVGSQPFKTIDQAAAQVLADYLCSTATWEMSDCN
jgi:hypothetical protein